MDTLWQDTRHALRMLRRNPGFALVVVLTLAIGIGANTAIFSVVHAVLLKPLPYPDPHELVQIRKKAPRPGAPVLGGGSFVSESEFVAWREQCRSLVAIAAFGGGDMNLTAVDQAERIRCGTVTADLFSMLGVRPALGRLFQRAEEQPGGPAVAVLSHGLWRRRFGGNGNVLGQTILLDHKAYEIVGVLPADFQFIAPYQVWTPMRINAVAEEGGVSINLFRALARLRRGMTVAEAQAEMAAISARANEREPFPTLLMSEGGVVHLVPLQEQLVANVRPALLVLLGAVASVLLIACANTANLLLARTAPRHREIAVRVALGARRGSVLRQLLTESTVLALLGGVAGLLLAFWGTRLLGAFESLRLPHVQAIAVDGTVLGFTLVVSLLVGLIFGAAPSLQAARTDMKDVLKHGVGGLGEPPRRYLHRGLLVIGETALAMVLLAGAGLLLKSFILLRHVEPGFRPEGLLTFQLNLDQQKFPTAGQRTAFVERVMQELRALPSVQMATATDHLPLTPACFLTSVTVEGRTVSPGEKNPPASVATVTPEYFAVLGIAMREGRSFTAADRDGHSIIVNESFARYYSPDRSIVGRRLRDFEAHAGEAGWLPIIGVVADVRQEGLDGAAAPEIYRLTPARGEALVSVALRAAGDPLRLASAVRARMQAVDRDVPVYGLMTMQQRLDATTAPRRTNLLLLGVFSLVALVLAAGGIYSVMSCLMVQRTREIGLRMALGAQRTDVLRLVVQRGMILTGLGLAVGWIGSFAMTRFLSSLLYEVSPTDPLTFVLVSLVLTAVALLACYVPARRAARIDPIEALRCE